MKLSITLLFLLIPGLLKGQIITEVTTDKEVYEYGEKIQVTGKVINNSVDEIVTYQGSGTLLSGLTFSNISFVPTAITTDDYRDTVFYGETRVFNWVLDPKELGIPTFTGEQTIIANMLSVVDSVKFNAPKYLGGNIFVYFDDSLVDTTEAKAIASSLNAEIVDRHHPGYYWNVIGAQIDSLGEELLKDDRVIEVSMYLRGELRPSEILTLSAKEENISKTGYNLSQNYPNPFNPRTRISFTIAKAQKVELNIYDLLGRKVKALVSRKYLAGTHTVNFDAGDLPSGIYIYRLITDSGSLSKKLSLIK